MKQIALGLAVGMLLLGTLCGCRAMSKHDTPGTASAPAPSAEESKPIPPPTPSPTPPAPTPDNPSNNKEVLSAPLLHETLGQNILPLIDGGLMVLQKTTAKGANDPNITIEGGGLVFNQVLKGEGDGQGAIHAAGTYQKLDTVSGGTAIYTNPVAIDFNFDRFQIKSECYGTISLTGKIHCTLNATYTYGANILSGTGQCMTHTNGILDNLRVGVGANLHKVRYVLGFKIQGSPKDWKAYQWVGSAYVDGIKVDFTQFNETPNTCDK